MTQEDLAERTGFKTKGAISRIENGEIAAVLIGNETTLKKVCKTDIALLSTILILTACSDEPMETETEKEIKVLFDVRYPA